MPIATGHEREELEFDLQVSVLLSLICYLGFFLYGRVEIVGFWLIPSPIFIEFGWIREGTFWKLTTRLVHLEQRSVC